MAKPAERFTLKGHLLVTSAVFMAIVGTWSTLVQRSVPSPYLDEVFHVRQAETYVQNNWHVWDPKITTPPGLYIVSYICSLFYKISGFMPREMDASIYRAVNWLGSALLLLVVYDLLMLGAENQDEADLEARSSWSSAELIHTRFNICLFPPLFFFYGLYYTDVLSALSVLFAYRCFLKEQHDFVIVLAGLLSLLFRQTNIFWVSIFLGGLALCRTIHRGRPEIEFSANPTFQEVVRGSWPHASAYDPLISEASIEDYIKSAISFAIAAVADLPSITWLLTPYLTILGAFAGFVVWNGGVVLGDKDNHIASIHIAQMLYLWPYFVFFSLPLLYPYFLDIVVSYQILPSALGYDPKNIHSRFPRLIIAIPAMAVMAATVHYNTIVHPFTLADNRHYMFYVFRLLLGHPAIKYFAVPVYFLCAWATLTSLGGLQQKAIEPPKPQKPQSDTPSTQSPKASENRVSFLLIWLLATTLSLATAPLVEPRYLIVPWLMWRLHVASPHPTAANKRYDYRLWLETVWFLGINVVTGYIFLYWGFEWPQEPGMVQRFMW